MMTHLVKDGNVVKGQVGRTLHLLYVAGNGERIIISLLLVLLVHNHHYHNHHHHNSICSATFASVHREGSPREASNGHKMYLFGWRSGKVYAANCLDFLEICFEEGLRIKYSACGYQEIPIVAIRVLIMTSVVSRKSPPIYPQR